MPTVETHPVLIKGNNDQTEEGLLQTTVYTHQDRVKRAILVCAGLWLLAALSVPLIFAHWVLVPGFLIAGPIVGLKRYRTERVPNTVTGQCPACHEKLVISLESTDQLPLWTYCSSNNDPIQLLNFE